MACAHRKASNGVSTVVGIGNCPPVVWNVNRTDYKTMQLAWGYNGLIGLVNLATPAKRAQCMYQVYFTEHTMFEFGPLFPTRRRVE